MSRRSLEVPDLVFGVRGLFTTLEDFFVLFETTTHARASEPAAEGSPLANSMPSSKAPFDDDALPLKRGWICVNRVTLADDERQERLRANLKEAT